MRFGSYLISAFLFLLKLQIFPQHNIELPVHFPHFKQIEGQPESLEIYKQDIRISQYIFIT